MGLNLADKLWAFLGKCAGMQDAGYHHQLTLSEAKALLEERQEMLMAIHDLQQEGTAGEWWAARERDAIRTALLEKYAIPIGSARRAALSELATAIAARGPLRPPLPAERLTEEVARLRAALMEIASLAEAATKGPGGRPSIPAMAAVEIARKALECG